MLRISVTTLESFRRFLQEEWLSEQKLISQIKREEPPSIHMAIGTAFHDILEHPHERVKYDDKKDIHYFESGGIVFPFETITKAYDQISYRYPFEVKTTKDYIVDGEAVRVVAMADQLIGNIACEHKTTYGNFDCARYAESYQWRYYCDLFSSDIVIYKVFEFPRLNQSKMDLRLKDMHIFSMWRYPGMETDLKLLLGHFVGWVKFRKLEAYLTPKEYADAA
ncbi:MAG: hypothetical protein ACLFQX_04045 [Candidatus Kapaibacterium sp.]